MRLALRIALAAALLLVSAAPAQAEIKSIWGSTELNSGRSAFPVYRDLGVDMLQEQLVWNVVATSRPANPRDPRDPAYHWPANIDTAYKQTRRYGMRLALMVRGTPGWANGGRTPNWVPNRLADYTDFVIAAAKRYRRVRHWMVWGEPTRLAQFEPLSPGEPLGPRLYSQMLDRTYGALKKLRRSNIVIGGMTFTVGDVAPNEFVRLMTLPNGKPPRLDWFGHNPFTARRPDLHGKPLRPYTRDFDDVDTFYEEIRSHWKPRHHAPRLWLSEFCVPSHKTQTFNFHVSPKTQGRWLADAFRIAHTKPWIAGLGWFNLQDNQSYCGLLTERGAKKPSYRAYKRAR
jgi:hypothetical protein